MSGIVSLRDQVPSADHEPKGSHCSSKLTKQATPQLLSLIMMHFGSLFLWVLLWADAMQSQPLRQEAAVLPRAVRISGASHPQLQSRETKLKFWKPKSLHNASDYLITSLPGLDAISAPVMHSGQLPLNEHTAYFFWRFQKPTASTRITFWMNGGPGCSSLDGVLMENGALRINKEGKVVLNNGSWHEVSDMVYVDQPGGTGFSPTSVYDSGLGEVSRDFLLFLKQYFTLFPDDLGKEMYLAGESYAGQYIPYIADGILTHNEKVQSSGAKRRVKRGAKNSTEEKHQRTTPPSTRYNLKGITIGNGWIDPNRQALSYIPFLVKHGILKTLNPQFRELLRKQEECQQLILKNGPTRQTYRVCEGILLDILSATRDVEALEKHQCVNMYDYTLSDSYPSCGMNWPLDLDNIYPFLAQESVMKLLHVEAEHSWSECEPMVTSNMKARNSPTAITLLPRLLEQIKVVLFFGDRDIICNTMGAKMMVDELKWGDRQGFANNTETDWMVEVGEGEHARLELGGSYISERNLTFVRVFNASHMVPYDKSEVSRGLMRFFDLEASPSKAMPTVGSALAPSTPVTSPSLYPSTLTNTTSSTSSGPDSSSKPVDQKPYLTSSLLRDVLQITGVFVILWALLYLYNRFTSGPSSILAVPNRSSRDPNSPYGKAISPMSPSFRPFATHKKKKSVQWVDQVDNFDDIVRSKQKNMLKKVLTRMGVSNTLVRANYLPLENSLANERDQGWDIELGMIEEDETAGSSSAP